MAGSPRHHHIRPGGYLDGHESSRDHRLGGVGRAARRRRRGPPRGILRAFARKRDSAPARMRGAANTPSDLHRQQLGMVARPGEGSARPLRDRGRENQRGLDAEPVPPHGRFRDPAPAGAAREAQRRAAVPATGRPEGTGRDRLPGPGDPLRRSRGAGAGQRHHLVVDNRRGGWLQRPGGAGTRGGPADVRVGHEVGLDVPHRKRRNPHLPWPRRRTPRSTGKDRAGLGRHHSRGAVVLRPARIHQDRRDHGARPDHRHAQRLLRVRGRAGGRAAARC